MEMEVANWAADTLEHLTNHQSSEFALMFFQFFLVESNGLCPRNERPTEGIHRGISQILAAAPHAGGHHSYQQN